MNLEDLEKSLEETIKVLASIYIGRPDLMTDFLRELSNPNHVLTSSEERICEILLELSQNSSSNQASK